MSDPDYEAVRARLAEAEDIDMDGVPDAAPRSGPPPAGGTPPDNPAALGAVQPLNDIGNGRRFQIYFGQDVRFVPRVGWFCWCGTHWRRDDDEILVRILAQMVSGRTLEEVAHLKLKPAEVEKLAESEAIEARLAILANIKASDRSAEQKAEYQTLRGKQDTIAAIRDRLRKRKDRHTAHALSTGNSARIDAMLREASVHLCLDLDDLDADPLTINVANGTLRFTVPRDSGGRAVPALDFAPHERADHLSKCCAAEYRPGATCPKFTAFLERILPVRDMREFVLRWLALSMTGIIEQRLAFFHGQGANGKSVLVEVIARILDGYAASAKIESLTGRSRRGGADATPDLIPLMGARMVRASEPEEGERFKEGMIKELTGGEPILVRALHKDFVQVKPEFKLTISGNHKPEIRGTDDGIWRRVMLVPFDVQIPESERRDFSELVAELCEEGPGILNLLLEQLTGYLTCGLEVPASVLAATADYRRDSDPVGAFLAEHTVVDGSEEWITAAELIEAFRFWQVEEGTGAWGNRAASLRFKEKAGRWRHPETGNVYTPLKKSNTGYAGIRLAAAFRDRFDARPDRPDRPERPPRGREPADMDGAF